MTTDSKDFEGWAILELMGHRKLAGELREATIAGKAFIRLDVPGEPPVTQFYSADAVYCITPSTEELVRAFSKRTSPAPIARWELPAITEGNGDDDEADFEDADP